jgi:putative transcriptional regulator
MKSEMFAELLASATEALEHARGKRSLKSTTLPRVAEPMSAEDVLSVRETLRASQAVFAHYLNVSTKLVQAWEASRRHPDGPALVLLRMMKQQPGLVDTFYSRTSTQQRARKSALRSRAGRSATVGKR